MLSVFCAPGKYLQGRNATAQLGEEIKKLGLGTQACILAGKSARKHLESVWKDSLSSSGVKYTLVEFEGECSRKEINRVTELARKSKTDLIIGAGGGKVLDAARAVANNLGVPVVNCPTVASSDAPCSALSVVYTDDGEFEEYIFYKRNPELVVVDSSVIAKGPERLLVAGIGDALATMFEAQTVYNARKRNQLGGATSISALALAELCYRTLVEDSLEALEAVRVSSVTPALERVIEANTLLSGLGFESGGLAVAHSVHNGLTTIPETHTYFHGEKVAFGLLTQLVLEGKGLELVSDVMAFCRSVGLPICLCDVGIEKPDDGVFKSIAERTVAKGETAHNEPFEVTAEMVEDALRTADSLGTQWHEEGSL